MRTVLRYYKYRTWGKFSFADLFSMEDFVGDAGSSVLFFECGVSPCLEFFCDSYIIEVAEADSPPKEDDPWPRLPLLGLLLLKPFLALDEDGLRDFTSFKTFFIVAFTFQNLLKTCMALFFLFRYLIIYMIIYVRTMYIYICNNIYNKQIKKY